MWVTSENATRIHWDTERWKRCAYDADAVRGEGRSGDNANAHSNWQHAPLASVPLCEWHSEEYILQLITLLECVFPSLSHCVSWSRFHCSLFNGVWHNWHLNRQHSHLHVWLVSTFLLLFYSFAYYFTQWNALLTLSVSFMRRSRSLSLPLVVRLFLFLHVALAVWPAPLGSS